MQDVELMKCLHYLGADINARDKNGHTILQAKSRYTDSTEHTQIAQMIASWDIFDLNAKDICKI